MSIVLKKRGFSGDGMVDSGFFPYNYGQPKFRENGANEERLDVDIERVAFKDLRRSTASGIVKHSF